VSEFLTLAVRGVEEGWIWLYTAGMSDDAKSDRVDELASDAWEHEHDAIRRNERWGAQLFYRFVLGMAADVSWRAGRGISGFERSNWQQAAIGLLLMVGVGVSLPLSLALSPQAEFHNSSGGLNPLFMADALFCLLALVLPGVLAMERWPVAGGLLSFVGCLCLVSLFWWLTLALLVVLTGLTVCVVGMVRLRKMQVL
jgi:hypothetical protein